MSGADPGFYVKGGALLGEGSRDRLGHLRVQGSGRLLDGWGAKPHGSSWELENIGLLF